MFHPWVIHPFIVPMGRSISRRTFAAIAFLAQRHCNTGQEKSKRPMAAADIGL
jgi:hypothetical protein